MQQVPGASKNPFVKPGTPGASPASSQNGNSSSQGSLDSLWSPVSSTDAHSSSESNPLLMMMSSPGSESQRPLDTEDPLLLEGKHFGNYRLVKKIGGGGFGHVYRAEHIELGNPFAIKVLHNKLARNPSFVERFRTEAMVLAGLRHENVVDVVDFGQHTDVGFYLVMEWLEGRTLHRVWQRKRTFPLSQIYALFSQLLDALDAAHRRGIVHRDMKPENLILTKGSRGRTILKIVDFGIATLVSGQQETNGRPSEGMIIGTPYYMSPEQAAGRHHEVDGRSDIYACGVILFELLTGRRMFASKEPKEILRHQVYTAPPRLESIPGKQVYSPLLQAVLDRALAKNKHERYATASEMFAELEFAMKSEGVEPDEEGIEANQARPASSLTSLLDMALGAESLVSDSVYPEQNNPGELEKREISPVQHAEGERRSGELGPVEHEDAMSTSSRASWMLGLMGVGLVALILLLLGLQPWRTLSKPSNASLTLPPVMRSFSNVPVSTRTSSPATRETPGVGNAAGVGSPTSSSPGDERAGGSGQTTTVNPPQENRSRPRRRDIKKRRKKRRKASRTRQRVKTNRRVAALQKTEQSQRLTLVTQPGKAEVFVNGKYRGVTPMSLQLQQGGKFQIQVKKKGFVTQTFVWKARRPENKQIRLIEDLF